MKFASLGSGSSGNATLIASENTILMLDCGFGLRETEKRLARLGISADKLSAILVTHEHSDHIKGVAPLARKYGIPVHMTAGTFVAKNYGRIPSINLIKNYAQFAVGDLNVIPVAVPHDAREPAQFVIHGGGVRLGVLTDLGCITPHIVEAYQSCEGLFIEANHDLEMLWQGAYPPSLKSRVASDWGHLNNRQAAELIDLVYSRVTQKLVLGHISRKNNSVAAVKASLKQYCRVVATEDLIYACQDTGFDWLELQEKGVCSQMATIAEEAHL